MQVYGMQRLESNRFKRGVWWSNEDRYENKDETNGQKEKIIRLQF